MAVHMPVTYWQNKLYIASVININLFVTAKQAILSNQHNIAMRSNFM
jgi:hypothetical protein